MANKKHAGREAAHIEFGKDWDALVETYGRLPSESQDYADPLMEAALKGGPFDVGLRWPFRVEGDVDKWPVGHTVREYAREGMKRTGKVAVCLVGTHPRGSVRQEIVPWDPKTFKAAYKSVADVLSKAAADPCHDIVEMAETLEDSNREYVRMSSTTEIAALMTKYLKNAYDRGLRDTLSRIWTYASVDGEGLEPPFRVYDADGKGEGLTRACMGNDGKFPEGFLWRVMCLMEDALHDIDHRDLGYFAVDEDGVISLWWPDEVEVLSFLEAFDKVTEKTTENKK